MTAARHTTHLAFVLVGACSNLAGIPNPAEPDAPADSSDDGETTCDYRDDDSDGLIDDGIAYVEDLSVRRTLDVGAWPGLWSIARSDDRIAVVWATGDGNAGDVVSAQIFTLDGAPVAPKVTTNVAQPWTVNGGLWIGDRFVISSTQREYACGGSSSTTCVTYLWAIDRSGTEVLAPTEITTSAPEVLGAYVDQDRMVAAFLPVGSTGSVRIRSFTTSGQPGGLDAELFATAPGESIYVLRAIRDGNLLSWVYRSSSTGLSMRLTDPQGQAVLGPIALTTDAVSHVSRGYHGVIVDGQLVVPVETPSTAEVRRWTTAGAPIGTTGLSGMTIAYGIAPAASDQLYVLAGDQETTDGPRRAWVWRIASDGRVIQTGSRIEIPDNHGSAAMVDTGSGVIVAIAAGGIGSGVQPITLTRFHCP